MNALLIVLILSVPCIDAYTYTTTYIRLHNLKCRNNKLNLTCLTHALTYNASSRVLWLLYLLHRRVCVPSYMSTKELLKVKRNQVRDSYYHRCVSDATGEVSFLHNHIKCLTFWVMEWLASIKLFYFHENMTAIELWRRTTGRRHEVNKANLAIFDYRMYEHILD